MVFTVRTDDARFEGLPDWPYTPRYVDVGGLRLARVDEGDGHPVVLLHGEPTWGFLWRHVLPPLLRVGLRVVVPDQVGFGRSDKPARRDWYSYDALVDSFAAHLDAIGLEEPATLVVHDWGGPVGLRWAVEHPDRVARLVVLDTGLYAPGGRRSETFEAWRSYVASATTLPVGQIVQGGTATELPAEVIAAYDAPFPDEASQSAVLALPLLVPRADDDPGAMAMFHVLDALGDLDRPALVLWADEDRILPTRIGERFARVLPGSGPLETVPGGHFLQEDAGPAIGERVAAFVGAT